jgi:hypothetical protein
MYTLFEYELVFAATDNAAKAKLKSFIILINTSLLLH